MTQYTANLGIRFALIISGDILSTELRIEAPPSSNVFDFVCDGVQGSYEFSHLSCRKLRLRTVCVYRGRLKPRCDDIQPQAHGYGQQEYFCCAISSGVDLPRCSVSRYEHR